MKTVLPYFMKLSFVTSNVQQALFIKKAAFDLALSVCNFIIGLMPSKHCYSGE